MRLKFFIIGVLGVWAFVGVAQQTNPSFRPPKAESRGHYREPAHSQEGAFHCFRDEKRWIEGQWVFDRQGRRKWVPGYWEVVKVGVPCRHQPYEPLAPPVRGRRACMHPTLTPEAFEHALHTVGSKSFESTRLSIATQILQVNCVTSEQVKVLLSAFSFECSRLEIAQLAYEKVCDPQVYFIVNDVFSFESSIRELQNYIQQFEATHPR